MHILFMGTPDIAAECLKALYAAGHDICAVYTRRDKPVGRKQVLTAPPVKEVALAHGTPVFQPKTLRDGGEDANIRALAPDEDRAECLLPSMIGQLIDRGELRVSVLHSNARWFGMTYHEDREMVQRELRKLHDAGVYPATLRE